MGLMMPIEHATRVDVDRAARVFRALGHDHTFVDVLRPPVEAFPRVCAHLEPGPDTTVSIGRGALAVDALEPIALGDAFYVDTSADNGVRVRLWSDRAWLHGDGEHQTVESEDRAAVFARFRELASDIGVMTSITAVEVAAALTRDLPCDDWQISTELLYVPETGALMTYILAPVPDAAVAAWTARLDAALARS